MSVEVAKLFIYPIKSMRPLYPDRISVEPRGLQHDRQWMVIDENGRFRTRREIPSMAQVGARFEGDRMILSKDGMPDLSVPCKPEGETVKVQIWTATTTAKIVSTRANEWMTQAMDAPSRLVRMTTNARRRVNPKLGTGPGWVGFADAYPILVASESSLEDLNSRLDSPITVERFRPNIVLRGSLPYEEETWRNLRIGKVMLRAARPDIRCLVTTQDPMTGESRGPEPLKTLATYRRVENGVIFGMYYVPEKLGMISIGDQCEPISESMGIC